MTHEERAVQLGIDIGHKILSSGREIAAEEVKKEILKAFNAVRVDAILECQQAVDNRLTHLRHTI